MEIKDTKQDESNKVLLQCKLGHELYEAGDYEQAIVAFESALKIAPNSVDAFSGKGSALLMQGEYIQALLSLKGVKN